MTQWTSDQVWQWMLESRGVPEGQHCLRCDGFGVYTYGTTSTWRHGVGGMTMTQDVCDRCWGSGRRDIAWPSHRECGQECPKPREDGDPDPYVCTLADCHEGPHVAEDLYGNICAAWNGTDCLIRPASPQAETKRDCTCLGACRGDEGLSPRYRCVLAPPQAETTKGGR